MALSNAERQKRYRDKIKKQKYKNINVWISEKGYQKLEIFRQNETMSFSEIINMLVSCYLVVDNSKDNLKKMQKLAKKLQEQTASEIRSYKKFEKEQYIKNLREKYKKK